ncbi:MAG: ATP synthase F1 subunit gamma [bacterium]|nr:ATP synthase F1 subunit gamma [bacterium]
MAVSPRLIRRRITSVQNTRKITSAMEMVAAAKMRRAVAAALQSRAYAHLAWEMVTSLTGVVTEAMHPLLRQASDGAHADAGVLYMVMASDRGLCGGFNAQLFRTLQRDVRERAEQRVQFVTIGKKAEQFIKRQGWELVASFTDKSVAPKIAELRPAARLAMDAFTRGEVTSVRIAFTDFMSALQQRPIVRTLLPLQRFAELGPQAGVPANAERAPSARGATTILMEPSPHAVLSTMLPRLVELQVYQAYLDTGASEHSARMVAMRSASDAASEMIDALSLSFNRARQAVITQEIAEISAGSAALAH